MIEAGRRHVIQGLAGLSMASILADKLLAQEAAASLETITIATERGNPSKGALARPAQKNAPGVVLVHEFWGLNDQIKSVAAELARQGYLALAVDLYDGQVASDPGTARQLMGKVDPARATDILVHAIDWMKANGNGKVATIGWCFGGGWSLLASLARPVDATVIYYGKCDLPAEKLASLKGPVLGHFAERDQWINPAMVQGFESEMKKANKTVTAYEYPADHAFANPTGANYDKPDAQLAWQRTLDFLKANLG
ncbi:MAG TPA: dienelactone hydrolase family protein [Dongiaceae bacterium]|jgi:carboxymethylenebutenolidase|nr:dienelactone hydrolase family protein [Dongiaceae bacterium]